jgi:Phosphodiester glycosidase
VFRAEPPRRRRRAWRIGALVVVLLLLPVGWSYAHALTVPGGGSLGVRSVEWLRGHGGSGIVTVVERWWYSHHPPPKGGKPANGLIPATGRSISGAASGPQHLPPPPPVTPIASPPLPGEGQWRPIGRTVAGVPTMYATDLRPDPVHTSLVTAVAWMDTLQLKAKLFGGSEEPGGTWQNMAPITAADRPGLDAAFNSGFRLDSAGGGYYAEGRYARPLVNGAASFVIYNDGTATVGQWGRDLNMGPDVVAVRQNLALLVDNGKPAAGIQNDSTLKWGATLGNNTYVWRSGVGVTATGALVYAGGPGLSAYTLADVLVHAGAVRAMELDINTEWVDYFYFNAPLGVPASPDNATKLISTMAWTTSRYFQAGTRDFFTMSLR